LLLCTRRSRVLSGGRASETGHCYDSATVIEGGTVPTQKRHTAVISVLDFYRFANVVSLSFFTGGRDSDDDGSIVVVQIKQFPDFGDVASIVVVQGP
jgi:hypothetical protein